MGDMIYKVKYERVTYPPKGGNMGSYHKVTVGGGYITEHSWRCKGEFELFRKARGLRATHFRLSDAFGYDKGITWMSGCID